MTLSLLRKCFAQNDCNELLRPEVDGLNALAKFEQAVKEAQKLKFAKINPIFYEIRDPQTNDLRACVIGTSHTVAEDNLRFEMTAAIRKCFDCSKRLLMESNPWAHFDDKKEDEVTEIVKDKLKLTQAMDFEFALNAKIGGKMIEGLESKSDTTAIGKLVEEMRVRGEDKLSDEQMQKCSEHRSHAELFSQGEESLLDAALRACSTTTDYRVMIDDRNPKMAATIDSTLKNEAGVSFITVGAAHLIGKSSVCTLLEKNGWKVQRIFEDSTKKV